MAMTADAKQEQANQDKASELIREFLQDAGTRGVWESHWQEIAERIWPSTRSSFNPLGIRTPGEKRTFELYDSTAALALGRFAAILDSLLTPRNQTWHKLRASNPDVNKDRQVQMWFDETTRILFQHRYAPRANFSGQNQKVYRNLGAFGTGSMWVDELSDELTGKKKGLRYRAIGLGQLFLKENHQGIVDTVRRYFKLLPRQAVQMFGEKKLPKVIVEAQENSPNTEFAFLHIVKPRADRDPLRRDFKGLRFAEYYVSMEGRTLLEEGGYNTFPYATSRYEQEDDEAYGRSPAMDGLPAIKTLNEEKKAMLKQGHRIVDPVLLASDDGILDSFSLKPGAINAGGVTPDGRPLVHALPTGNVQAGKEMMDDERKLINDLFLVNLFQILTESPQMTATEVMERTREKGILLAPTIGRQQSEYLGPMIERELDLLSLQGLLPPMPGLLKEARGEFDIIYDSPLSKSQRMEEATGVMRTLDAALQYFNATQDHSAFDFFDIDQIMVALADINNVPTKWIRSLGDVQKIRASRSQQQQMQQVAQMAPGAAAVMSASAKMQQSKQ